MDCMKKTVFVSLVAILSSVFSFASEKEGLDLLAKIKGDPVSLNKAINAGQIRSSLCGYCHGDEGTSQRNYIPNLAGQNVEYLIHQFELFSSGVRKQSVMEELSRGISVEDRVNLSLYFSSKMPIRKFDVQGDAGKGEVAFAKNCESCHGAGGLGNKRIPRLSSQPQVYLVQTLTNLKSGNQIRTVPEMAGVLTILDDKLITDISAYLAAIE